MKAAVVFCLGQGKNRLNQVHLFSAQQLACIPALHAPV